MDDDRMIGAMVTALAEPRTPPPDALDRIAASASAARRRHRLARGAAVIAAACVIAGAVGFAVPRLSHTTQPTSPFGSGNIRVYGDARVFTMEIPLAYPTGREILHGAFVADGREFDANFYTDDNDDVLVESLEVGAGERIYLDGIVWPDCEGVAETPRALIRYRLPGGLEGTQVIEADATTWREYRAERASWCSAPVHADLSGWSRTAQGKKTFTLNLTNTTDHRVEVVSASMTFAGASWPRTSVSVAAGETARLSISPTNYHGGPKPWTEGLLTVDGEPVDFLHY